MSKKFIIQVALPVPITTVFDYFCIETLAIGTRVLVPFGVRKIIGIVYGLNNNSNFDLNKIKTVIKILDKYPIVDNELLFLCKWLSKYYGAPIGEVLFLSVPKALRNQQKPQTHRTNYIWHTKNSQIVVADLLKSAKKQWELWLFINSFNQGVSNSELNSSFNGWHNIANILLTKDLLTRRTDHVTFKNTEHALLLNNEQQSIVDNIKQQLSIFKTHLLYGITGSGKTEVYLQIIESILDSNQQVLILVPEISLTPQTSQRFNSRFAVLVQTQHSKLSDTERYNIWQNCSSGKTKILISTRSGLFNPFDNLGLIIVDEEHDLSFKQQDGVRYSARDMAIIRAKYLNIPIILGSATPALESILNVKKGNYQLHKLTKRAGDAKKPKIQINDMSVDNLLLSSHVLQQIKDTLSRNLQVMIFINRRGFSPVLHCKNCGVSVKCPYCEVNLTVHKNPPKLICHHCEYSTTIQSTCNQCNDGQLLMLGAGTEKIEQQLQAMFADHCILRIDKDTTRKKQAWRDLYQTINNQKTSILIGTQMLAKGHHFPKVALVIIVGVDNGLFSADFRSFEHLAQLIVQVSGRAGRANHQGLVILQTKQPKHLMLNKLLNKGYWEVCQDLLIERELSKLPPFTSMCILRTKAKNIDNAKNLLIDIKYSINDKNIEILGPIPAPMEKRAGSFRFQLILQADTKAYLQHFLKYWLPIMRQIKNTKNVKLSLDVDPINLM